MLYVYILIVTYIVSFFVDWHEFTVENFALEKILVLCVLNVVFVPPKKINHDLSIHFLIYPMAVIKKKVSKILPEVKKYLMT